MRPIQQETHLTLVENACYGVAGLYDEWMERGKIDSFLLTWPEAELKADDGTIINAGCALELPKERSAWGEMITKAVIKTRPYAMLLGEQKDKEVIVILETTAGAHCWRLPIKDKGDRTVLGEAVQSINKENIGVLWRPKKVRGLS